MAKQTIEMQILSNAKIIAGELRQVNAELHNVRDGVQNLNTSSKASASATKSHSSALKGLALRFVGYNLILNQVMAAQQKLIDYIKESVEKFREFETRLAEISTILGTDFKTVIIGLGAGIENLSLTYGKSTSDMSKGLYDILSAAFDTKDAINLLNTATRASIAGLSEVRTSVSIFTGVLNAYGKSAEQAAHVSDVLFQSVVRGKFQFEDLESALGYVVPIAAQAGIEFDELMASLSTATRHGLHLDMTARGLALAIQNIINPSKQAADAADKYGIEMNGLALQVMGLYGWFEQINLAVKEFGSQIIGQLIPNMRSLRVAMVLASDVGLEGFSEDLLKIAEMGNATERALNKIMNTSQFVANQLSQEWEKTQREVGDAWDEIFLGIQEGLVNVVKGFDIMFHGFPEISKAAEKYTLIEDDTIHNAKQYLLIQKEIFTKSEELLALGERPTAEPRGIGGPYGEAAAAAALDTSAWDRLEADIEELTVAANEFVPDWNKVVGGFQDAAEEIGNLEILLGNIELSITDFEDKLRAPIEFGWSGVQAEMGLENLKGSLYYQFEILKATQQYVDITHDVEMGLADESYGYKVLSERMQENIAIVREHQKAQQESRKATQEMSEAMRLLQIQMLEIQLKGMLRRRGLTRAEQKQMKKIQIEQAKLRLENMKAEVESVTVSTALYNERKEEIDKYLLAKKEEQYQIKYSYDQQITDFEIMLGKEEEKLQNRYNWWADTNQKIITSTDEALEIFEGFSDDFIKALAAEGIEVGLLETAYKNLNAARLGEVGKYPAEEEEPEKAIKTFSLLSERPEKGFEGMKIDFAALKKTYGSFQRGIRYVPETGPAMLHRGEMVSPAGKESPSGISIENVTIEVKEITEIDDIEKLGALLSQAESSGFMKKGKTNFKLRIG